MSRSSDLLRGKKFERRPDLIVLAVNEKRAAVGYGALDGGDVLGSAPPS
jgi:hypothetical protein